MQCRKCKKEIPDYAVYCLYCGKTTKVPKTKPKTRGNGEGSVYKQNGYFVAQATTHTPQRRVMRKFCKTRKEAVAILPELRERLTGVREVPPNISFEELFTRWVPFYQDRICKGSMGAHKSAFKHFSPLHRLPFGSITVDNLQDCLDNCGRGKRTKEDMKCLASLLYKYAYNLNLCNKNLAVNLYCGREQTTPRPALSLEQVERIRNVVGKEPYADFVYCNIYTGFRPGEMLELKRDQYDPTHKCFIGGKKTEAGRNRIVTISPKILPIVEQRYKNAVTNNQQYLFGKMDGSKMSDEYYRKHCFAPLMEKLDIKGVVPYSCRHTFANLLKSVYGSDTDKAALMGHADAGMTKYYQSADYASLQNITDKI